MFSAGLVVAALVFTSADADVAYGCASNLVAACTPRDAGTVGAHRAANWIHDMLGRMGAEVRCDTFRAPVRCGGKTSVRMFTNLYACFPTSTNVPWVVITTHYDTKPGTDCPGANDGASTTGLLMALAATMIRQGHDGHANVMLAWLDGEECRTSYAEGNGLWGSRHMADELQRRETDVRAVVCLDMLGDRNLDITLPANGTPGLVRIVQAAARRSGVLLASLDGDIVDDHVPFLEAGYPAVDLIDFEYGSAPGRNDWWHTRRDTMDNVSRSSLCKAGRLVVELINILSR